ncbi:MAG: hypothetical protein LBD70_06200 [Bifidobacteriaceae bacterium]|jgi:hypothetical protein|nr:hypothetical protein [Bifidobacteriaceae bacterium]
MSKSRWPLGAACSALVATLAACAATLPQPTPATESPAADSRNLIAALAGLESMAAACAAAAPPEFEPTGLDLLAAHAPDWFERFAAAWGPAATGPGANPSNAECQPATLRRDLTRTRALAVRLAGSGDAADDAASLATAIARAAAADEAILFGSWAAGSPPAAEDLAALDPALLTDLALAEDQAGFVGEHLAAQVSDAAVSAELAAAAALHRDRAEVLVALSGQPDPRQAAYALGPPTADPQAARERLAAAELALASHYAAAPGGSAAEPMLTWQLVQAASWGAKLPALPFLQ